MTTPPSKAECMRAIDLANQIVVAEKSGAQIALGEQDWGLIITGLRLFATIGMSGRSR